MRTSIKAIVVSLGFMALQGTAVADDQASYGQSRALYRSIAMQGDQALMNIRASNVDSISQSMNHQMAAALPSVEADNNQNASRRVDGDMDLTALVMER